MAQSSRKTNLWTEAWHTLRLAWRLFRDPRVSLPLKFLVPGLAFLYVLFPIDVAPDLLPILGQLDDLAILILAARLLIELSPPAVVAEHELDLGASTGSRSADSAPGDFIDARYRIVEE